MIDYERYFTWIICRITSIHCIACALGPFAYYFSLIYII